MRFRKYQTALEKGKSPDMPDWSPWLTKYKSRLRWLEICKKEYNPAPFTQIPEQPGESTTGEGAATSGMLEASGSGTMRAAAMPTDP